MATRDLSAFFDAGLEYPGVPSKAHPAGKTYKVPSPDAKTGLWLAATANVGLKAAAGGEVSDTETESLKLDDDEERNLYQRVLGPVYDEMLTDGVDWLALQKIGQDAYLCFAMSEATADLALTAGAEGKAQAPNRAARRSASKTAGSKSRRGSGVTAKPTRKPASRASSTSPTVSEAAAKAV